MNDENESDSCKVVIIGEMGVGKTSIIAQFLEQSYEPNLISTTGAIYSATKVTVGDKEAKFELWDTAGQEKYRALTKMFYRDATAAVIVYDITRLITYTELKSYWVKEIQENAPANIITAIAANKSDLYEKEEVDEKEARQYAKEIGALFKKTSAKNAEGIENLFVEIGRRFLSEEYAKSSNDIKAKAKALKIEDKEEEKKEETQSAKKKCC